MILFKSSKTQTYLYYFIYPLIISISIWVIYKIFEYGARGLFLSIIVLTLIYSLISAIESIMALKYVEVSDDGLSFGIFEATNRINFRDIHYAYSLINHRGSYGVIWYKDSSSGKLKVILIRPKELMPNKAEGIPIINYIKERAEKENPNYLKINNERWFLFSISPTFKIF